MIKPLLAFLFLLVHFTPNNAFQADIVDQLAAHFKLGNSKAVSYTHLDVYKRQTYIIFKIN